MTDNADKPPEDKQPEPVTEVHAQPATAAAGSPEPGDED
jgi:hypothetical protein